MIRRNTHAMQHFGFINMTSADENGIKGVIVTIMNVKVVLDIISLLGMFFGIYILFATTQYHINLSWIFANFLAQYAVSLTARIYLIISQLNYGGEYLLGTAAFDCAIIIRMLCTLTCLICYTGVILERVLATIWVRDYERKSRKWIPILIIPLTYVGSGPCTYLIYSGRLKVSTIAILMVILNFAEFLLTVFAYRYSKSRCYDGSEILEGVLSWRYQQEENLRSWMHLRFVLSAIVFFNILMGICLASPDYMIGDSSHITNVSSIALDQTILLYGLICPFVALYFNKLWQREILRLFTFIGCGILARWLSSKGVAPENKRTILHGTDQQDAYFNQLRNGWDEVLTGHQHHHKKGKMTK